LDINADPDGLKNLDKYILLTLFECKSLLIKRKWFPFQKNELRDPFYMPAFKTWVYYAMVLYCPFVLLTLSLQLLLNTLMDFDETFNIVLATPPKHCNGF
jgi:hypothetical protein